MRNLGQLPEELQGIFSQFHDQWKTTSSEWNDEACQRFEREFMDGYEEIIRTTLKEMENMAQILAQASKL